MARATLRVVAASAALAVAEGFALAPAAGCAILHARGLPHLCRAGGWVPPLRSTGTPGSRGSARHTARRPAGGLAMQTEKSATTQFIVGFLAFGFLFGALFPLINNGLRVGTAGDEMSGAATGMRQKELDSRLAKVRHAAQILSCHLKCLRCTAHRRGMMSAGAARPGAVARAYVDQGVV